MIILPEYQKKKNQPTMPLFSQTVAIVIISWIFICLKDASVTARPSRTTDRCPYNESEWNKRASEMLCQGSDSYHCFLAEDGFSVKENCIEKTLILEGFCPIFTDYGYLHWSPCNGTACPNSSYKSDEVYRHQICLTKTGNPLTKDSNSELKDEKDSDDLKYGLIGTILIVFVICVSVAVAYRYCKPGTCIILRKPQETQELHELQEQTQDEDIANGVNVLKRSDILYIIGQLGNSVSTLGKDIAKKYKEDFKMEIEELHYLDLSANLKDNTVYFVDGWCGLWNDNLCERDLVKENHNIILQYCENNKKSKVKFVIGLRSDFENMFKPFLFPGSETIRRDSYSTRKEQSIVRHLEILQRNCKNPKCQCQALTVDKILSIKNIGPHLALKLVELDHSLADQIFDANKGPVIAVTGHFKSLEFNDKDLFGCIFYLVLNGFYDEENFRNDIAEQIPVSREKMENQKLEFYTRQKPNLATTWSSKITNADVKTHGGLVFWHNFLYICAFHACYNSYQTKVMQYANVDAILQLVRPFGTVTDFTVQADVHLISLFEKRIKGTDIERHVADHPLLRYLREKEQKSP